MKHHEYRAQVVHLLTGLIDVFFPPSRTELLLRSVEHSELLQHFHIINLPSFTRLASYSEPIIRAAVTENKFHHNRRAAKLLATLVSHWLTRTTRPVVFVPVPLGRKRLRTRGHNQVETILRLVEPTPMIDTSLLMRVKETKPQSELAREERLRNIASAFAYTGKPISVPVGTLLVIVDDVVTTGATLKEAQAALAPHLPPGVSLICLAIAH